VLVVGCSRVKLPKKNRAPCVGDLRDRVVLQNRRLVEPTFGSVDLSEEFTGREVWASVTTKTGRTIFDGVATDVPITHEVLIRFDSCVTSETWVRIDSGHRLDVARVEDLEERHEWLLLSCTDKGLAEKEASRA
jgi:SPP1 family predicted phage head-tail adaptor